MPAPITAVPVWASGIDFGVAFYGAPAVALVVIFVSFFTAKRRGGLAVPLCGWALLVADVAIMAADGRPVSRQ